ncbi:MAG: hypothetical protein JNJ63_11180 [Hyphomonadaceae bacterium]|nr:hypothetical protein [Hyphomonadaceae bacterium]
MILRKLIVAAAMLAAPMFASGPACAAIATEEQAPAAALGSAILGEIAATPADKDAVLAAITRATRGADLRVIVEALRQLRRGEGLEAMVGPEGIAGARATLARPEVQEALAESFEVAQLALQSYGATGGVPAGGAPGQAFGSGGVGAPGGGGGSGYTN